MFDCSKCDKTFSDRKNLTRHYRMVHSGVRFYCEICGGDFARQHNVTSHMLSSHGVGIKKTFDCSQCDKKYPQVEGLHRHNRLVHSGVRFYCDLCGKNFTQKVTLRNHMQTFHGYGIQIDSSMYENAYPCNVTLNRNNRMALPVFTRFTCEICGRHFAHKKNLKTHAQASHDGIPKIYDCSKCDKKYSDKSNLNRHYRSAHARVRCYCELCGSDFAHKKNIMRHMQSSHGYGVPKKLTSSKRVNGHHQTSHLGVKFNCQLCGKKFSRETQLKDHEKSTHLEIKSTGDICSEQFPLNGNLVVDYPERKCDGDATNGDRSSGDAHFTPNENSKIEGENVCRKSTLNSGESWRKNYSQLDLDFANSNKSDKWKSNLLHNADINNYCEIELYAASSDVDLDESDQLDKSESGNLQNVTLNESGNLQNET